MSLLKKKSVLISILILLLLEGVFSENENPLEEISNEDFLAKFITLKNSAQEIRSHSEDGDFFLTLKNDTGKRQIVNISGEYLNRRIYDEKNNLSAIEYWIIDKNLEKSFLEKKRTFTYSNMTEQLSVIKEENYKTNLQRVYSYNESMNLTSMEENHSDGKEYVDGKVFTYRYDDHKRLLEESVQFFEFVPSKKLLTKNRTVYRYMKPDCPPDFSYYEDDILRIRTVYQKPGNFIRTTYFDNNLTAREVYENDRRVTSTISSKKNGGAR